jgi:hypothetical protein
MTEIRNPNDDRSPKFERDGRFFEQLGSRLSLRISAFDFGFLPHETRRCHRSRDLEQGLPELEGAAGLWCRRSRGNIFSAVQRHHPG